MKEKRCQCSDHSFRADSGYAAVVNISAASHLRAQLPGILKYRGLDDEAQVATHLVRIESIIVTMQAALKDLEMAMVGVLTADGCTGPGKQG